MAQTIHLLDSPFTLEWIDHEANILKAGQDNSKKRQVVIPAIAENTNVVHVKLYTINAIKDQMHFLSSNVQ